MTTQTAIHQMVNRIAKRFKPDKIVLFGSHARDTAGADSDVDLLVVMRTTSTRRHQATAIDKSLMGIKMPADVIVATPEDIERCKDRIGSIIRPALREGKVVYERRDR